MSVTAPCLLLVWTKACLVFLSENYRKVFPARYMHLRYAVMTVFITDCVPLWDIEFTVYFNVSTGIHRKYADCGSPHAV